MDDLDIEILPSVPLDLIAFAGIPSARRCGGMIAYWHFFRAVIRLRHEHASLREGACEPLRPLDDLLAFRRSHNGHEILMALNIAAEPRTWQHWQGFGRPPISTYLDRQTQRSRSIPGSRLGKLAQTTAVHRLYARNFIGT